MIAYYNSILLKSPSTVKLKFHNFPKLGVSVYVDTKWYVILDTRKGLHSNNKYR